MAKVTGDSLLLNPWRLLSHPRQSGAIPWTQTQTKQQKYKQKLAVSSKTRTRDNSVAALPFDLSPPPIDHDLLDTVATAGAKVSDEGIIETFDNDDQALDAVENGVAVVDLSHFCRIRVSGEDRIQFLHNQSTANFECLDEGQGCDTVFVTPTARTIDIAHAWVMKNAVMLLVSPSSRSISEMLNKYIFFNDKVEIQDITKQTCFFVLVGPKSNQVMEELNLGDLVGQPYGSHQHFSVNGMPITVGVGNVISEKGFSLLMSPAAAGSVWKAILSQGATPMGANAWEKLRIFQAEESPIHKLVKVMGLTTLTTLKNFMRLDHYRHQYQRIGDTSMFSGIFLVINPITFAGKPAPQKELTNDYNVLEAGLWNSISLSKGCYKGQETISRLITYDGVKQRLWGICLSGPAEPGSLITVGGKKVGKLTSCTSGRKEFEYFGLGYIKRQNVSEGDTVVVGDAITGTVVEVPFLAGQRPPSRSSSS